ncbi:hypothetical protein EMIT0111MI5_20060 [Burkholderia sp. IT-111MI5]
MVVGFTLDNVTNCVATVVAVTAAQMRRSGRRAIPGDRKPVPRGQSARAGHRDALGRMARRRAAQVTGGRGRTTTQPAVNASAGPNGTASRSAWCRPSDRAAKEVGRSSCAPATN